MTYGQRALVSAIASLAVLAPLSGCGNDNDEASQTAETTSPAEKALAPVVEAVVKQHGPLHDKDDEAGAPAGLVRRFIDQEEGLMSARRRFLEEVGPCRFVCGGRLTPLGGALLARPDPEVLTRHQIDPKPYDMPGLKERVDAYLVARKEAVELPAGVEAPGRVVLEHLSRQSVDAAALRRDLLKVEGHDKLTAEHVEAIAAQVDKLSSDKEMRRDEARLEAELAKALLRHVVDWRFIDTAGPKDFTRDVNDLIEDKEDEIIARMTHVANADDPAEALEGLEPQHPMYGKYMEAWGRYKKLAEGGGCEKLPDGWTFKPGVRPGFEVVKLKERLACEGYYDGPTTEAYSDLLKDAIKKYQRHHDMEETGYLDEGAMRSVNVTMERRAEQIALSALRLREAHEDELGDFYVRVNIPSYSLEVVEFGEVIRRQKVIVGTNKLDDNKLRLIQGHINRTPLLRSQIYEVVVNPDWILPKRVSKGEVVGELNKDPDYLKKNNIRKMTLDNGREVLVQGPGEGNVLGKVKFLLRDSNAIFLHDTNDPYLFKGRRRALSHGCMRVEDAVEFAKWMLIRDGWSEAEVLDTLKKETVQRGMALKKPIPFQSVYRTVSISDEGMPVFYSDVYRYDRAYFKGDLPPLERVRWGDARLRPHWVPKVDEDKVEAWRKAGKAAPRDLKPE